MATRYTARSQSRFNVPGLPSGYQSKSSPDDFTIPPVGLSDVDKALYDLFNSEIPLIVGDNNGSTIKVPVVFFAGEKWALNKRLRALRDRNGALILPLITAVRKQLVQAPNQDITGRGINQQTGEIVIHRRLDKTDRGYQQLINRLLIDHQPNLAVNVGNADAGQLTTLRAVGELANDPVVKQGGLMVPDRTDNIFETIVVPSPQFFTAQYDVTVWTQYTSHMNQIVEQLISSFLPQGNAWRLDTDKGYWFVATVDANTWTNDSNADDYSQTERVIKHKFTVNVPGYILASAVPGAPVALKRYVSSPTISFTTGIVPDPVTEATGDDTPFLGADDPTLPLDTGDDAPSRRRDQRDVRGTRLYPNIDATSPDDPALSQLPRGTGPAQFQKVVGYDKDGNKVTQYFRVLNQNRFTGETVLSAEDATLGGLTFVLNDD